jgi:hypothetical protein
MVETIAGAGAFGLVVDKAGLAQEFQMLGNRRLGEFQCVAEITAATAFPLLELADDFHSRWVCQRLQLRCQCVDLLDRLAGLCARAGFVAHDRSLSVKTDKGNCIMKKGGTSAPPT